ncbi:rhomboid domain-containing protein 3 isoform X2 [Latimeria chalumnae]|uniref:rhomboid domain-containing protein 3 isoform X2 n=1 Tax=Latimeria chalumnae TaxID=7897 RepID=UPI0003C1A1D2|nr:PREDICTED: rhomboid domain-containing protein 3 isoform X2 [Latimeria chalumnae]|eukprot:XP_006009024.1 PREDICTED: rhomboid domain-containing protein 3 isoform X2 [Latimeria chalumnae]
MRRGGSVECDSKSLGTFAASSGWEGQEALRRWTPFVNRERKRHGVYSKVHRLLTYGLCHSDLFSLLLNVLMLFLLGRQHEWQLGTITFLYLTLFCTALPAVLYILVAKLLSFRPLAVCGFTTAQITMQCSQLRTRNMPILGPVPVVIIPFLLLLLAYLFLPDSSLFIYLCGVGIGLAYPARVFSCLKLSDYRLEKLERLTVCKLLRNNPVLIFTSSRKDQLPVTDPAKRFQTAPSSMQNQGFSVNSATSVRSPNSGIRDNPSSFSMDLSHTYYPAGQEADRTLGKYAFTQSWTQSQHSPLAFSENSAPVTTISDNLASEAAFLASSSFLTDEELLNVGILTSLQESGMETDVKVEVPKSSVPSLRLQQLEKMGFPTDKAVVALAAAGKLEGAISLLIKNDIGDAAVVTTKGRPSTS